jgi:hypothetical protein
VWARRALNDPKWRFPARAVERREKPNVSHMKNADDVDAARIRLILQVQPRTIMVCRQRPPRRFLLVLEKAWLNRPTLGSLISIAGRGQVTGLDVKERNESETALRDAFSRFGSVAHTTCRAQLSQHYAGWGIISFEDSQAAIEAVCLPVGMPTPAAERTGATKSS